MTRSLSLLAAVLLAGSAIPALAQERYDPGEPPPLPEWTEHEWDEEPRAPYPEPSGEWRRYDAPLPDTDSWHAAPPPPGHGYRRGYLPGYPGPVMWVKVPIERDRDCCECHQVVEKTVVEHRPPAPKRVKIRRIVPAK